MMAGAKRKLTMLIINPFTNLDWYVNLDWYINLDRYINSDWYMQ